MNVHLAVFREPAERTIHPFAPSSWQVSHGPILSRLCARKVMIQHNKFLFSERMSACGSNSISRAPHRSQRELGRSACGRRAGDLHRPALPQPCFGGSDQIPGTMARAFWQRSPQSGGSATAQEPDHDHGIDEKRRASVRIPAQVHQALVDPKLRPNRRDRPLISGFAETCHNFNRYCLIADNALTGCESATSPPPAPTPHSIGKLE